MTESVKYTLESRIDGFERELDNVQSELERMEHEHQDLLLDKKNLIKQIEEHKRSLLKLYTKE